MTTAMCRPRPSVAMAMPSSSFVVPRASNPSTKRHPSQLSQPQQTQNTAPIYEYNCLYTHDLRRKQKRWQDGFLRFHTFNSRVMVYDLPAKNFLGDTHLKGSDIEIEEGQEILCEKAGVIVEVGEKVGENSVDLRECVLQKKNKGNRSPVKPVGSAAPAAGMGLKTLIEKRQEPFAACRTPGGASIVVEKHRSLNDVLRGKNERVAPTGKANWPGKSPFQLRYGDAGDEEDARSAKRRKVQASTPAKRSNDGRAVTTRVADGPTHKRNAPEHPSFHLESNPTEPEVFYVTDDDTDPIDAPLATWSIDAIERTSPPAKASVDLGPRRVGRESAVYGPPSSPAFERMATPTRPQLAGMDRNRRIGGGAAREERSVHSRALEEHIDDEPRPASNRSNLQQDKVDSRKQQPATKSPPRPSIPSQRSQNGFRLRMATKSKKHTLLCQDQLSKSLSRMDSAATDDFMVDMLDATSLEKTTTEPRGPKTQRKQLEERQARMKKRKPSSDDDPHDATTVDKSPATARQDTEREEMAKAADGINQKANQEIPRRITNAAPNGPAHLDRPITNDNRSVRPTTRQLRPNPPVNPHRAEINAPGKKTSSEGNTKLISRRPPSAHNAGNSTVKANSFKKPSLPTKPSTGEGVIPERLQDPWSREAFDLFDWRPPGWNEERWCIDEPVVG